MEPSVRDAVHSSAASITWPFRGVYRGAVNSLPLVWAHRGASRVAPENSLLSISRAREAGADGVELDVMRCASGEPIIFHDFDLRAFGRPERVASQSLTELRRIDLGGGSRIPTLDDALDAAGARIDVNLEVKEHTFDGDGLEREIARTLSRRSSEERGRIWFSSFNPRALVRIAREMREACGGERARLGFLFHVGQSALWRRGLSFLLTRPRGTMFLGAGMRGPPIAAIHPHHLLVTPALVSWARRAGVRVHAWTVDREADVCRIAALDVDAIITNEPQRARATLEGARELARLRCEARNRTRA
jgi:glycerophosphoryl diester phosphodiesterase